MHCAKRQAPNEMAEIVIAKPEVGGERSFLLSDKLKAKWPGLALQSFGWAERDPLCQAASFKRNGRDRHRRASGGRAEIPSANRRAPSEMAEIGVGKLRVGRQRSSLPSDKLRAKWSGSALQSLRWAGRDRFFQPTNSCEMAEIGAAKLRVGGPMSPLPNDKLLTK